MGNLLFVSIQIAMAIVTVAAVWRRKWIPFALFAVADGLFVSQALRSHDGWTELALFATFLIFVLPLYAAGGIVWLIGHYRRKNR
ncbi:hypothetical protein [Cohnella sp. GCM10027633]|uniref:hypothetical protein n=1 Tax=unclassified Cohnella TaxID=2636738 RepID=UPI00363E9A33